MRRSLAALDFFRTASVVSATGADRRAATIARFNAKAATDRATLAARLVRAGVSEADAEAQAGAKFPNYRGA